MAGGAVLDDARERCRNIDLAFSLWEKDRMSGNAASYSRAMPQPQFARFFSASARCIIDCGALG
jgi:hypothetical protein